MTNYVAHWEFLVAAAWSVKIQVLTGYGPQMYSSVQSLVSKFRRIQDFNFKQFSRLIKLNVNIKHGCS